MNTDITIVTGRRDCAGCGACAVSCPAEAISLRENAAGFYEASIDAARCVHCGVCAAVCPRLSAEDGKPLAQGALFALQSSEAAVVRGCSSGGLAHELSRQLLESGVHVCGAVYDREKHRVRHLLISDVGQLSQLDGSKYLQSDPSAAFAQVLRQAKADPQARFLLFGTPCQIAGMAAAAQRAGVRSQLLLAELFCHGVPSYRVWDDTVRRIETRLGTQQWDSVSFRHKKDDWHSYCLRVEADGRSYYGKRETEPFWQVFFEDILLGDACWHCRARTDRSRADLRLGDYWGRRFLERSDGVSAVFALTEQGRAAVEQLLRSGRVRTFDAGTPEEMLRCQNMAGYRQTALHERAMEQLRGGTELRTVVRKYRRALSGRQRLKILLLRLSAALPDGLRARARKAAQRTASGKD